MMSPIKQKTLILSTTAHFQRSAPSVTPVISIIQLIVALNILSPCILLKHNFTG